ncbi:MAG: GspE/PulE family protein [Candidatus Kerfeldbacteria bacterium]
MMLSYQTGDTSYRDLWKILERKRFFSREQFKEALQRAKDEDRHLNHVLLEIGNGSKEKLLESLSEYYGTPTVTLRKRVISPFVLNLIPKEIAEQHSVVLFKKTRDAIHVATTAPDNAQTIDFIKRKTGLTPQVFITTPEDIDEALRRYKSDLSTDFARIIKESTQQAMAVHDSAEKMAQYVPVITMVNTIIERALLQHASDIHIEPHREKISIRFRIDGLLVKIVELPSELLPSLVTRIKLIANLKIDEHRLPQDGRFSTMFDGREIAIRVAVIPTLSGSKVAMRLLDSNERQFSLKTLGLSANDLRAIRQETMKPHGMILVTGPTGSGKTTTLYTLLRMLRKESVNICTIEDPIEYGIEGISQTQVNPNAGLTFANGLRSLLRQDPNIIMVGEIRDADTASIAINAAMTGHLVLTTLHTNNAFLAIQRLIEMGVEPFLASSVINVVIGQRLVRRVCRYCKGRGRLTQKVVDLYRAVLDIERTVPKLIRLGLLPSDFVVEGAPIARNKGCAKCNKTGYLGRVGIYEVIRIDEDIHHVIIKDPSAESIQRAAEKKGVLTMIEDGILKVLRGQTTIEEVLRVVK